jgi:hypothetical protein
MSKRFPKKWVIAGVSLWVLGCESAERAPDPSQSEIGARAGALSARAPSRPPATPAAAPVCNVPLMATHLYGPPPRTTPGSATLASAVPFTIPAAIAVIAGGARRASVDLVFQNTTIPRTRKTVCSYRLPAPDAPLADFVGCSTGETAGAGATADSFELTIVRARRDGPSETEIQFGLALDVVEGTPCADSNACFASFECHSGKCDGLHPVLCTALDQCHVVGTCDPTSGQCSNPAADDGTLCDDGDACTQTDSCQNGSCSGSNPVVCKASDQCHDVGTCDPTTGMCSNPTLVDGTSCDDGDACTQTDLCQQGTCTGSNPVICPAGDQCHGPGTCDPATGLCSAPVACADGQFCCGGVCVGKQYVGTASASVAVSLPPSYNDVRTCVATGLQWDKMNGNPLALVTTAGSLSLTTAICPAADISGPITADPNRLAGTMDFEGCDGVSPTVKVYGGETTFGSTSCDVEECEWLPLELGKISWPLNADGSVSGAGTLARGTNETWTYSFHFAPASAP